MKLKELPVEILAQEEQISKRVGMNPSTMITMRIIQRLEAEQMNETPAVGAELPGTAPTADTQPNHEGVIVDGI